MHMHTYPLFKQTTGKASGMGSAPVEDLSPEEKAAREKRANTYHAQTRSRYTKSKWSGKVDPTSLFSNIAAEELDEEEDGSDGRGGQQGAEKANKKHMKNLQAEVAEAFEQYSGEGTRDGSDFPFPGFHDK